jgi:general secretion pathway protein F
MPTFSYKATNTDGGVVNGSIETTEEALVVEKLHELGLIPIRISVEKGIASAAFLGDLKSLINRVTAGEVLNFTHEMASLVKSGVPLDRSLRILINSTDPKRAFREVLNDVHNRVMEGSSLAEALGAHPRVFSRLYVNMVKSGELSGALDNIMERLAGFLENSAELKSHVLSAMIYPAILGLVSCVSILVLLIFVIPRFSSIFADVGAPLPLPTAVLMGISGAVTSYWWVGAICLTIAAAGFRHYIRTPGGRLAWDGLKLRAPVIGPLVQRIEIARFSRTMGTILKGGVPMLQCLDIVKEVAGNIIITNTIGELYGRVKKGEGIGSSLRGKAFIPPLAVEMIAVGEETGRLQEILLDMADTFDKQVREQVKRILSLMEPVLILVMGLIVGAIVVSMLLALFSVNEIPF